MEWRQMVPPRQGCRGPIEMIYLVDRRSRLYASTGICFGQKPQHGREPRRKGPTVLDWTARRIRLSVLVPSPSIALRQHDVEACEIVRSVEKALHGG